MVNQIFEVEKELEEQLSMEDQNNIYEECLVASQRLSQDAKNYGKEFLETIFLEKLNYTKKNISYMKKSITIQVELQGQEKKLYRIIEMPYQITLADMTYIILASFQAHGRKEFFIKMNNHGYISDTCLKNSNEDYASLVFLSELFLKQNDCLTICYDMHENYVFEITVLEVDSHENIQHSDKIIVKEACGYGIWEGAHQLLNTYYRNYNEFLECIQKTKLDEQDYFTEDYIDNKYLFQQSEELKIGYEELGR